MGKTNSQHNNDISNIHQLVKQEELMETLEREEEIRARKRSAVLSVVMVRPDVE